MAKIWLLTDDRAGNVNQLLGIAEALGEPWERKEIRYNRWVRLPNLLRGGGLIGIDALSRAGLTSPWPDVVLAAGRRAFPVARYIRRQSGGRTRIVQVMNPGRAGWREADLIVLPAHDDYRGHDARVMTVVGAPHRVSREKLRAERAVWEPRFQAYPHKRVALIVGGATKDKPFPETAAHELVRAVRALQPASVLATTSRRTPPEVVDILQRDLPQPCFFYRYGDAGENPYFGLLSTADEIVVTGDSLSMCSECCATGVPVHIFAPATMMGPKHKRFHTELYARGFAVPLGLPSVRPSGVLNPAYEIAEKIKTLLQKP